MENVEDIYPLSPLQESLLGNMLSSRSRVGFEQTTRFLSGELDAAAFQRAWQTIVDRHTVLRTAFLARGLAEPLQVVRRRVTLPFAVHDWQHLTAAEQHTGVERLLREDQERGFDPERAPLMRVALIRLGPQAHLLVWSHHHLILDGWCRALIQREVLTFYRAFCAGEELRLPPSRPFRVYIEWLQRQDLEQARGFWRRLLHDLTDPTPLVVDRLPGPALSAGGPAAERSYDRREVVLPPSRVADLEEAARDGQVTPNTIAQAAWALLLSRYSAQDDVVFGTAVAGRPPDLPQVESIMGMFINNLPVRVRVRSGMRVAPWLVEIQDLLVEMRRFDYVSPSQVQDLSGIPLGARLFDSLFLFQNYPVDPSPGVDPGADPEPSEAAPDAGDQVARVRLETSYPLTLVVVPRRSWTLRAYYDRARFAPDTIERLLGHLASLLQGLAGSSNAEIAALPLLSAAECQQLIVEPQGARPAGCPVAALLGLIDQHAARFPDALAIQWGAEGLQYGQLLHKAEALATELRESGCRPGSLIGIRVATPPGKVAALLAVLKTGGALVLFDRDRQACPEDASEFLVFEDGSRLRVGRQISRSDRGGVAPPVVLSPGALSAALFGARLRLSLQPQDVVLVFPGLPEAQILQLLPLAAGARLALPQLSPDAGWAELPRAAAGCGATVLVATPGQARDCLETGWNGLDRLRKVLCGGPPLSRGLADRLLERGVEAWSLYGARESGGWIAARKVEPGEGPITVGAPCAGVQIYVLDRLLVPQPVGVPGEVWLGGEPLARGYAGSAELTAERFTPDPFSGVVGARLWRTGDLARRLATGELELLGRTDQRSMNHGRGVRPGEIEAVLRAHADVCEAVVEPWDEPDGSTRLVAYLSTFPERPPDPSGLRRHLQRMLPAAMVPSAFCLLRHPPLTPEGRLDRRALPRAQSLDAELLDALVAPRSPLELRLLRIWEDLFGIRPLGVTDDFFALGGHSLLALRLKTRIKSELGKDLPLTDLLRAPTIAGLAGLLTREEKDGHCSSLVAIRAEGALPPLFAIHPEGGGVLCYVELAQKLGNRQPFYGLQAPGWQDEREPLASIGQLAALYLREIHEVQPQGPHQLLGWSSGGFIVFEMACRLVEAGEPAPLLLILDCGINPGPKAAQDDARFLRSVFDIEGLSTEEELRSLGGLDRQLEHLAQLAGQANRLPADFDLEKMKRILRVRKVHRDAGLAFEPRPYPGRVVLLRSAETLARREADPTMGWGSLALGGVEVYDVPGPHRELMSHPWVRVVAEQLGVHLKLFTAGGAQAGNGVPTVRTA